MTRPRPGAFIAPFHPPSGDPTAGLHRDLDLIAQFGPFGGVLIAAREWASPAQRRRSSTLMAESVMPALQSD